MDHGGDLTTALAHYGYTFDDWLDLSTGINPYAYPHDKIPPSAYQRLPSRDDMHTLLITARRAYNVPDNAAIAAAPGSQTIIQMLPTLFAPKPTQIVGPTYSEHESCWRAAGHKITRVETPDLDAATFLILGNPNNPDCRMWDVSELVEFAKTLAQKGGLLIVDEAFVDATPELSCAARADTPGLLILRSFGKFFGLAGLRIGFAIGEQAVIRRLQALFGPWPVSGPAIFAGTKALGDEKWITQTKDKLKTAIARLTDMLSNRGLHVKAQTSLFVLVETGNATALHDHLARHAIWTRNFTYNNGWLRIGIPATPRAFDRLDRALKDAPLDRYSGT